jgi:hypothetical protein
MHGLPECFQYRYFSMHLVKGPDLTQGRNIGNRRHRQSSALASVLQGLSALFVCYSALDPLV